jgi:hypothetical protein
MIQKVVTRKQIPMTTPMTMSGVATPTSTSTSTGMETDENGKAGESVDMDMSEDEEEMDLDRPPAIVEMIEPPCEFVEQVEDELMLMPKCIQTMSEMQKLFAFLGHTKRLYGNVSHFVRALNTKLTANGWDSSDKNYECKFRGNRTFREFIYVMTRCGYAKF